MSDATWAKAQAPCNEAEFVELLWVVAIENYFNLMNVVLGIGSDRLAETIRG